MYTWFDPQDIKNIISITIVTKHYPMSFNMTGDLFTVYLHDREIVFRQSTGGLYYFDNAAEKDFGGTILTSVV